MDDIAGMNQTVIVMTSFFFGLETLYLFILLCGWKGSHKHPINESGFRCLTYSYTLFQAAIVLPILAFNVFYVMGIMPLMDSLDLPGINYIADNQCSDEILNFSVSKFRDSFAADRAKVGLFLIQTIGLLVTQILVYLLLSPINFMIKDWCQKKTSLSCCKHRPHVVATKDKHLIAHLCEFMTCKGEK